MCCLNIHWLRYQKMESSLQMIRGEIIEPKMLRADWKIGSTGKCSYDYYMEKEIMEQPRVMTETLLSRLKRRTA